MQDLEIYRVGRYEASEARGVVIVIDVIRAFSVAAYAMAGGAQALWLVRTVEEAFALRERNPGVLLIGEGGGRLYPRHEPYLSPTILTVSRELGRHLSTPPGV